MRRRHSIFVLVLIIITNLMVAQVALADERSDKIKSIEKEFMCNCGCNEGLKECDPSTCGTSANLKEVVGAMVDEGKSKGEVVQFLRTNYGDQLLAAPPKEGFNMMAYVTPFLLTLGGIGGLVVVMMGWVRRNKEHEAVVESGPDDDSTPKDSKYNDKLKDDLDDLRW